MASVSPGEQSWQRPRDGQQGLHGPCRRLPEAPCLQQLRGNWSRDVCCLLFLIAHLPVMSTHLRDQVDLSWFESRKRAFLCKSDLEIKVPAVPSPPLFPCPLAVSVRALKLYFRWWQNSKAQSAGSEPEFSEPNALHSFSPATNASWAVMANRAPLFLLSDVFKRI